MLKFKAIDKIQNFIYSKTFKRFGSNHNGQEVQAYSRPLQLLHWIQAGGFIGCVATGYIASSIDPKKAPKEKVDLKWKLMNLHKSFGVLMFGLIVPRLYFRFSTQIPPQVPGMVVEHIAAKISHLSLYTAIVFMPLSGVIMGYYSGFGVPFFKWKFINGAPKELSQTPDYKKKAGLMYKSHKFTGQVLEYLIPIHIGAVAFHHLYKNQKILSRMSLFK